MQSVAIPYLFVYYNKGNIMKYNKLEKIISGGQTGADRGGLRAGLCLGIETGGVAPKGYRTEDGFEKDELTRYGLTEHNSTSYIPRTKLNVKESDGTVVFCDVTSAGSRLTVEICRELKKPYIISPTDEQFISWLNTKNIRVLNVAGNRESVSAGIDSRVFQFLIKNLGVK